MKTASITILIFVAMVLATCVRPADQRAEQDLLVGRAELPALGVVVLDGQAAVRDLSETSLVLWAQAPLLEITLTTAVARTFLVEVRNCMPGSLLNIGSSSLQRLDDSPPTSCLYRIDLQVGANELFLAPPDWNDEQAFRFADMGDIQTAMSSVHEVFDAISQTPDLRFVMSTGDVVERGEWSEYQLFEEKLSALNIPFYSTVGNHELTIDSERWHQSFGRYSVHFRFKGVDFSYLDSGNASLDPILYERLARWLEAGKDRVHIFGTHYPPIDPIGARNAGFRSRNEASMLLAKLAEAEVDLTLYGHVHSLYEFTNAGIPAYISGGGGALPERLDGIDRHFLVIEADPTQAHISSVEVIRVATP